MSMIFPMFAGRKYKVDFPSSTHLQPSFFFYHLLIDNPDIHVHISIEITDQFYYCDMLFCDNNLGIALASQAACPLFAKLSLELRNQIYEHVFTTDEATNKDLETAKSQRAWSNLLLTCQRIFAESNGIYRVARTAYWRESTFYVDRLGKNMLIWL